MRPWRYAPIGHIGAIVGLAFLIFCVALAGTLDRGLRPLIRHIAHEQTFVAMLSHSEGGEKEVERVAKPLGASTFETMKAKEFTTLFERQMPDLVHEMQDLGEDLEKVLPRMVLIHGSFEHTDALVRALTALPGIESVESLDIESQSRTQGLEALAIMVRFLGIGLALLSLIILIHCARIHAFFFADTQMLAELSGASLFARSYPSLLSSLVLGGAAGLLAAGAWSLVGAMLLQALHLIWADLAGLTPNVPYLAGALAGIGMLLGVLSGFFGSLFPYGERAC